MDAFESTIIRLRCRVGRHTWGAVTGGVNQMQQTCAVCGRIRRRATNQRAPEDSTDNARINSAYGKWG